MHVWSAFNAFSTFKFIERKEDIQVSVKLLNNYKRICNDSFLSCLYKVILQEEE